MSRQEGVRDVVDTKMSCVDASKLILRLSNTYMYQMSGYLAGNTKNDNLSIALQRYHRHPATNADCDGCVGRGGHRRAAPRMNESVRHENVRTYMYVLSTVDCRLTRHEGDIGLSARPLPRHLSAPRAPLAWSSTMVSSSCQCVASLSVSFVEKSKLFFQPNYTNHERDR